MGTKQNPSDFWGPYTNSHFSERHLNSKTRRIRTSGPLPTIANLTKLYVGISFISTPNSIAMAGLYTSIVGFIYVIFSSIFCVYLLIKARNRFKSKNIIDICDLGVVLYGDWMRPILTLLLLFTNSIFLICYLMFFGS